MGGAQSADSESPADGSLSLEQLEELLPRLSRALTPDSGDTKPWINLKPLKPMVQRLLLALDQLAGEVTRKSDVQLLVEATLACSQWGREILDIQVIHTASSILGTLDARRLLEDASIAEFAAARSDFCAAFHNAVTTLCKMAYAVTSDAGEASVNIPSVRWQVAKIVSQDHPTRPPVPAGHIKVTEIKDQSFATRAFTCVAFDLVREGGDHPAETAGRPAPPPGADAAGTPLAGEGGGTFTARARRHGAILAGRVAEDDEDLAIRRRVFDVMRDRAPRGFEWRATDAIIVFTGTETFNLFLTTHVWVGGGLASPGWGEAVTQGEDGVDGRAHGAWLAMARGMRAQIRAGLADARGSLEYLSCGSVWVLGHSLGAALATLTVPYVCSMASPPPRVFLSTLASPRVFDADAAKSFGELSSVSVQRFVLPSDPVPSLPPEAMGFKHVGFARVLRPPSDLSGLLDPTGIAASVDSHRASTYRRSFEEYGVGGAYERS